MTMVSVPWRGACGKRFLLLAIVVVGHGYFRPLAGSLWEKYKTFINEFGFEENFHPLAGSLWEKLIVDDAGMLTILFPSPGGELVGKVDATGDSKGANAVVFRPLAGSLWEKPVGSLQQELRFLAFSVPWRGACGKSHLQDCPSRGSA